MRRGGLPAAINVKVRTTHVHRRVFAAASEGESLNVSDVCVQECVYCEDAAAAPIGEDLPDMDMGELGEEISQESQNKRSQSERPQPQQDTGS